VDDHHPHNAHFLALRGETKLPCTWTGSSSVWCPFPYFLAPCIPFQPLTKIIRYISDVGAFKMKPLFITGAAISGIFFILTIFAIHHVRFDSRMHGFSDTPKASKYVRISSRAAVVFVVIAALSLIILSIFDTYRFWHVHRVLLFTLLLSTSLSVGCVNLTYYEEAKASEDLLLRRRYVAADTF
jgi:hypothetical protein